MDPTVASNVMFLTPTKTIWDTFKETYGHEKNISCVFKIYEQLFSLQQGDHSVHEIYTSLCALLDELEVHQSIVSHAKTLRSTVMV